MLLFADMIANGRVLYRDATVYPLPGAFWLLAAAFRVFGASNLVARWILVLEFALFTALVFALVRRIAGPRLGWLAVAAMLVYRVWAFPHWNIYNYSSTALVLQLAALAVLLRFLASGRLATLAAAGLLFGLGVLCKQDYGAAVLAAFAATIAVAIRTAPAGTLPRPAAIAAGFLGPAALVGAAAGLVFWRTGVLGDVLRFTVLNHFVGMSSFEYSSFPSLLPLFGQDPLLRSVDGRDSYMPAILFVTDWPLLRESSFYRDTWLNDLALKLYYFAPYPIAAIGLARLVRRCAELREASRRPARLAEVALFALALALMLWVRINNPQDYVHLALLYWPMLLLPLVWLGEALARLWRAHPRFAAIALALLLVPAFAIAAYSARLAWRLRVLHDAPVPSERAGIFATPREAALLGEALAYIAQGSRPGKPSRSPLPRRRAGLRRAPRGLRRVSPARDPPRGAGGLDLAGSLAPPPRARAGRRGGRRAHPRQHSARRPGGSSPANGRRGPPGRLVRSPPPRGPASRSRSRPTACARRSSNGRSAPPRSSRTGAGSRSTLRSIAGPVAGCASSSRPPPRTRPAPRSRTGASPSPGW